MPFKHSIASLARPARRLLIVVPIACAGCSQAWWNAFLDPSQVGNFRTNEIVEIQKTISFYDKPYGVAGATDPTPEDLVAYVEEYRIGAGDVLSIRLLDFLQVGAETDLTPLTVDELGYINVPQLGLVQAEGRSAYELQQDLIQRAKQAQIYNEDSNPTVTVTVTTAQQRTFNISGPTNLVNSGLYPIVRPDFRLRDAVNLAGGGLDPLIKNIWVIRNQPRPKRVRERSMQPAAAPPVGPEPLPIPPVSPAFLSEAGSGATAAPDPEPAPGTPATRLAVPRDQAEQELIEAVEGGRRTDDQTTQPATPSTGPAVRPAQPNWTFINDRFIERQPETTQESPPDEPQPTTDPGTATQPVDWEELAQEGQQRIIRIPADKLRNGEPSVDIVVRHQDWIRLDPGPVGFFYLSGHVNNPGAFSLNGEEVTLRQAITSAGGLDPLAWPTRCSITRRIDENREEVLQLDLARIMEGKDPDFYLKPNDLVDVGTHAIAPLLLTIRNSLRLTYGFGFVYDRNFADIDAYFPQQNPRDIRRAQLQQRFPGLFP